MSRSVHHRFTAIEQDVRHIVGFLFVLFDEQAVGPGLHLPAHVTRIIVAGVFACQQTPPQTRGKAILCSPDM